MQNVTRDLASLFATFDQPWSPRVAGEVDGHQIKLVKLEGAFHWHAHANEDEMFLVVAGVLRMELRDRVERVGAGQFIIIGKGVEHRPVAETEPCHVVLIERASVVNTGDGPDNERTVRDLATV